MLCFGFFRENKCAMEKYHLHDQDKRLCDEDVQQRNPNKNTKPKEDSANEEDSDADVGEFSHPIPWQKLEAEELDCDYALLFSKEEADDLFTRLEEEVVYSSGTISALSVENMTGNSDIFK